MKTSKGRKPGNPKTGGRRKGTPNKTTAGIRQTIQDFIVRNFPRLQREYNKLDPKEKLLFLDKMLRYTLPTMQSVEAKIDVDIVENLNEENVAVIIKQMQNEYRKRKESNKSQA